MPDTPKVMISSTFYDLQQVRADLGSFLQGLGYTAVMSESPSFPIDPSEDAIENCRRRAATADLFVLVVGGRYGAVDPTSGVSVTNMEYLAARARGIPIYVFVQKRVLDVLPIWQRNRDADLSDVVDTANLFEFVASIRNSEKAWVFPFEQASDITAALRIQFAYLFDEALDLYRRARVATGRGLPALSGRAFRLALDRPDGWEYLLLFQTWLDEVEKRRDAIRSYEARPHVGPSEHVALHDFGEWTQTRLHELRGLIQSANVLINEETPKALGAPGESGDADEIVWVSQTLGGILDQILEWAQAIRRARTEDDLDEVKNEMADFANDTVTKMQTFPRETLAEIEAALAGPASTEPKHIQATLTFEIANLDRFNAAFDRARARGL
jgi:hypothetical protein